MLPYHSLASFTGWYQQCSVLLTSLNYLFVCSEIRLFLQRAVHKMLKVMPLNHPVLQYAGIVNPGQRDQCSFRQLSRLASAIIPGIDLTVLESEYLDYQVTEMSDNENVEPEVFWAESEHKYPLLCQLMFMLMSMPHSNAGSERMFSMLRKIHTESRHNLSNTVIRSLMTIKVNEVSCCTDIDFDNPLKRKMKHAASEYNKSYCRAGASSEAL